MYEYIGKNLSSLPDFSSSIAAQEGCKAQLEAPCLPLPLGMSPLRMTGYVGYRRPQGGVETGPMGRFQRLDNGASDVRHTHRDVPCRHGHPGDELRGVRPKPFERCGRNRRPNHAFDHSGLFGIKGMQMGRRFPLLAQQVHLPSPFSSSAERVERGARRRQGREQRAEALGPAIPADDEAQTQGASGSVPAPPHATRWRCGSVVWMVWSGLLRSERNRLPSARNASNPCGFIPALARLMKKPPASCTRRREWRSTSPRAANSPLARRDVGSGPNACSLVVSGGKTTGGGASQGSSMVVWSATAAGLTVGKRPGNTARKALCRAQEGPSWSRIRRNSPKARPVVKPNPCKRLSLLSRSLRVRANAAPCGVASCL